jgi:hypothetical protein
MAAWEIPRARIDFNAFPNVLSSAIGRYDLTFVRSFFPGFCKATVSDCRKCSGQYCRSMDALNSRTSCGVSSWRKTWAGMPSLTGAFLRAILFIALSTSCAVMTGKASWVACVTALWTFLGDIVAWPSLWSPEAVWAVLFRCRDGIGVVYDCIGPVRGSTLAGPDSVMTGLLEGCATVSEL